MGKVKGNIAVRFPHVFHGPPTIRMFVALWVGSALLVWAILVAGWFVAEHRLSVMGNQVVDNIRALDTTRKLESAVLDYRHEDLLWYATGKEEHQRNRNEYLQTAEKTAQELASYVDVPKEHDLWATIQERLKALRDAAGAACLDGGGPGVAGERPVNPDTRF